MIILNQVKLKSFLIGAFALLVLTPALVQANTVVRTGENVSVAEDQIINGDFYSAAETVNISGVIEEDLIMTGGQITLNGSVGENVFVVAGGTDIHGPVGDDLRIIAGEVIIADAVAGDVFIVGGSVDILSSASIAGDILVYGGEVKIEAPVQGDILGNVSSLRIDSVVEGNIDVTVSSFTLGDRAVVRGSVTYESPINLIQALNSSVEGEIIRNDPIVMEVESGPLAWLLPSLVFVFSTLVWYLLSRKTLNRVIGRALVNSPRPSLLGLAVFILTPLAVIVLFASMIGWLVGFALLVAYILLVLMSLIALMATLGKLMQIAFNRSKEGVTLITMVIGFVTFGILSMVPVVGPLIIFILMIINIGAMTDIVLRHGKQQ